MSPHHVQIAMIGSSAIVVLVLYCGHDRNVHARLYYDPSLHAPLLHPSLQAVPVDKRVLSAYSSNSLCAFGPRYLSPLWLPVGISVAPLNNGASRSAMAKKYPASLCLCCTPEVSRRHRHIARLVISTRPWLSPRVLPAWSCPVAMIRKFSARLH